MNQPGLTDENGLLLQLQQGDEKAFEVLYHRYKGLLYTHAYKKLSDREEVRDIIHEIFSGIWEKRETLNVTTSFSAYLYQAVRFKVIDRLSKGRSAKTYLDSLENFAQTFTATTDHRLRENMLRDLIEKEINNLPTKMRQVFELSRKEGLSHKEIAELLSISEEGVRSHIKHALRILRLKVGVYLIMLSFWDV
ncbi:MAG TPA: RNA polymerase sigma-70 factor [Pseudosphingobacterium sp.]|nr:RNA polymerase sigma-70 factor [Pseudosphingobacterium sp.]